MKLTQEQVRHVANLARLSLSDEEQARMQTQLSAILEAVETLNRLDVSKVEPTTQVNLEDAPLREDAVTQALGVEKALANAPQKAGTSFAVPKIIE